MTEAQTALSRRAGACKGFRWMPGMLRLRVTPPGMRDYLLREGRVPDGGDPWVYEDWLVIPDVTDPATLGCVLALVREAWGDPAIYASTENDGTWGVFNTDDWLVTHKHDSEAEALVAALEGAP